MNINYKHTKYFYSFLVFLVCFGLNAQTVDTYFGINSNNYLQNIKTDTTGNLYLITDDYNNQQRSIKKINSNGIETTIVSVSTNDPIYFHNLVVDSSNNLYFISDDYNNQQRSIKKIDSNGITTTIIGISTNDPIYFQNLVVDASGNLYFIIDDNNNQQRSIKKIDSNGAETSLLSESTNDPIYFQNLVVDISGILYFVVDDYNNQQRSIKKIDANGNATTIKSVSTNDPIYFYNFVTDTTGNLYFISDDNNNQQRSIKKIDSNGSETSVFSATTNGIHLQNLIVDTSSNLYYTTDDFNNQQRSIKKIEYNGNTTSIFSASMNDPIYFNNFIADGLDNIYFLGYYDGVTKIMIIKNPNYVCSTPSVPTSTGASICGGLTTVLSASGLGEMRWYDSPTGGNLLATGNSYTTNVINTNTTFYVEGFFCNFSSDRIPVTVTLFETPIAMISGDLVGNDFVSLTVSGNGIYQWSGGYSTSSATNIFTKTGTYSVTVTNPGGCIDTKVVNVVVNKMGLNKFGQLITDPLLRVTKDGNINSSTYLNKHGKTTSSIAGNGDLNYTIFSAPPSHPNNAAEFSDYTNVANQTSAGTHNANILLDWSNATALTTTGISIPNGGDRFALQVTGFFIPSESGVYTFTCEGDDAVDLFIDNINIANHYGGHGIDGLGSHTGSINLIVGNKYSFRARMQENGGGEGLRVFWRKPSQSSGWEIDIDELTSSN